MPEKSSISLLHSNHKQRTVFETSIDVNDEELAYVLRIFMSHSMGEEICSLKEINPLVPPAWNIVFTHSKPIDAIARLRMRGIKVQDLTPGAQPA